MSTKNDDSNHVNYDKTSLSILDKLGGWLIFLCFLSLIIFSLANLWLRPEPPAVSEISITITTDSIGGVDNNTRLLIDSLANIVKKQDLDVRERYAYLLEQKESESNILSYGGYILSIIIAIFGFFGYNSFKSIETKAASNAEDVIKMNVKDKLFLMKEELNDHFLANINNKFKKEYDTTLEEKVSNQMREKYDNSIMPKLNMIDQKQELIDSIDKRLTEIETLFSKLKDSGVPIGEDSDHHDESDLDKLANDRKKNKINNVEKGEE